MMDGSMHGDFPVVSVASDQAVKDADYDQTVTVGIYITEEAEGLPLPSYATAHAAGMDLYAAIPLNLPVVLHPGSRALITTGLRIILPHGFEGQVRARSGLAMRHGIGILNGPGTIDSDYRGVVQILLVNWGDEPFEIRRGDRIAQLVIAPVIRSTWEIVSTVTVTERGEGGFGSTGVRPINPYVEPHDISRSDGAENADEM